MVCSSPPIGSFAAFVEFGKPGYAAGARQAQVAATFKIVYGWMCAGLALSGTFTRSAFSVR